MALIYDRDLWPRQFFDPSCPRGGSWFACTTGSRFVGCCSGSVDPCDETTSCRQVNLRPASFDIAYYAMFPDQACAAGSNWYTCTGTNPAFMGCCKSNPCSSGCPTNDLTAASLSDDEAKASAFITASQAAATSTARATTSTVAVTTSTAAVTTSTAAVTTSTAAATTIPATPYSAGNHVGAIAGGAIGGVACLCLAAIGIIWCMKRRRQARKEKLEQQRTAEEYKNDDGHFHNTYTARQVDTPTGTLPEYTEEPRRTVYSVEGPQGIEVLIRPYQGTSTRPSTSDQHGTTQNYNVSPNISRPTSVGSPQPPSVGNPPSKGSPWFTRDSIFTSGNPQYANMLSPDEDHRASWIEQYRRRNKSSPMTTPIRSPPHRSTHSDYFGAHKNHSRNTSSTSRLPISPQNDCFELDNTQLSPHIELEAIEPGKESHREGTWQSMLQQPTRRHSRHDVEDGRTGSAFFSPDDIGKPESRG